MLLIASLAIAAAQPGRPAPPAPPPPTVAGASEPASALRVLGQDGDDPQAVPASVTVPPPPKLVMGLKGIQIAQARIEYYEPRDAATQRAWLERLWASDALAYGPQDSEPFHVMINDVRLQHRVYPGGRRVEYMFREAPKGRGDLAFCRSVVGSGASGSPPVAPLNNWCGEKLELFEPE